MKITQHGENYNVELEAGETVSITIGGINKEWTVSAGQTGKFSTRFSESTEPEEPLP